MRRFFLIANFLLVSLLCFAQQNIPGKIIGKIPEWYSPGLYQIQVGAFKINKNAEDTLLLLQRNGLNPASERYLDFTRVMVKGIPANQIMNFLAIIKQAGFNEVIIREDTSVTSISEKWEISSPDSEYTSFEFNHDRNYIAVENNYEKFVHFGEYDMPQMDIINMENLGTIKIKNNTETGISFSFLPIDEPEKELNFSAVKAETIPESPELDLFCRTWKVVDSSRKNEIGLIIYFSNAGTYFYTHPDGKSNILSRWRWYDENMDEFEYTHDDWEHYGRARINELEKESLKYLDPGYNSFVPGFSNASMDLYYNLIPINIQ